MNKKCELEFCENPIKTRGLCPSHLYQKKVGKKLTPIVKRVSNQDRICGGPECDRQSEKKGYCQSHYQQVYVYKCGLKKIATRTKCLSNWCDRNRNEDNGHGLCNKCKCRFDKYEMPISEFVLLDGTCDICGSSDGWSIDHDHKTNAVRGILCRSHNLGLGMIGDTIEDVRAVLNYLEKNG